MSFLTDVAVVTIGGEDEAVAFVNARISEGMRGDRHQLRKTDLEAAGAGGTKVTSLVVYAACFNWLDVSAFEEAVRAAPWRLPGCVVVYVDGEAEPTYVFSPARDERWETRKPASGPPSSSRHSGPPSQSPEQEHIRSRRPST